MDTPAWREPSYRPQPVRASSIVRVGDRRWQWSFATERGGTMGWAPTEVEAMRALNRAASFYRRVDA
jgi:hypothetical protein